MVDFEQETSKIENWQKEQGWTVNDPFTHVTNPELFVGFDELLKKLYHFAALGKNYAVVYGQYGYGKTALLKKIAHEYAKKYNVVFFEDAPEVGYISKKIKNLCPGKLMRRMGFGKIDDFDYPFFNKKIRKRTVLIFDESHSIDDKVFSYVRNLSEGGTVFSVVFAGKPELVTGEKRMPQYLLDRLELSEGLRPLEEKEAEELVKKRVELLANSKNYLFTDGAIRKIIRKSRFIPREILESCSKMIEIAIRDNIHAVDEAKVDAFYRYSFKEAAIPEYKKEAAISPEESISELPMVPEEFVQIRKPELRFEVVPDEKISTYERIVEGAAPKFDKEKVASFSMSRDEFLAELSPLQKRIVVYLFRNEPKTSPEIAEGIQDKYDTIRHMLKRLQGKYNEPESKRRIISLYPIIEEKENPQGRGYIYALNAQVRKIMSVD